MPNSAITPTIAQYFVPEIWATTALEVMRDFVVMPKLVTRDTEVASFTVGDILHIPYPGTFASSAKTAGENVTVATPSNSTEVQLTLDTHREVTFIVEDITKVFANQDLMRPYVEAAVPALAYDVEDALLGLYAGLSTEVGVAGTDLSYGVYLAGKKALTDAQVPTNGRKAVISTKDEMALLQDEQIVRFLQNSRPEVIAKGALGEIAGFETYVSQRVIEASGTTHNLMFNKGAFILGMRGFEAPPSGMGAVGSTQMDADSGLAISVVMSYNPNALGVQVTLHILFGVKELRDAKGLDVLS